MKCVLREANKTHPIIIIDIAMNLYDMYEVQLEFSLKGYDVTL